MNLEATPINDLFVLHRPVFQDARGQFTRLFAAEGIAKAGRPTQAVHVNASTSVQAGTLRGIHFQFPPYAEAKIVACTAGAIWDVAVDLRASPRKVFGFALLPRRRGWARLKRPWSGSTRGGRVQGPILSGFAPRPSLTDFL